MHGILVAVWNHPNPGGDLPPKFAKFVHVAAAEQGGGGLGALAPLIIKFRSSVSPPPPPPPKNFVPLLRVYNLIICTAYS